MTTSRFVCVHGHFYQPPRENPWLEAIEPQESAYPFANWNERIAAECYRPNAAARIVDGDGYILRIVNNYARISFDVGPTLMSWLATEARDVYGALRAADLESRARTGHGGAIAQAYNHIIMPLANRRDKHTQVLWGVRAFERDFLRAPVGMWLPETAVDLDTLEVLADHGIEFTILAPQQALRVRPLGGDAWRDVSGGRVDPGLVYRVALPSRRAIDVLFYDGPVSNAIAFEHLLNDGERFASRLLDRQWSDEPRLSHVATDGESYGHHHRQGEMALAFALQRLDADDGVELTNYAAFRADHPAAHEVEIAENTSWSCAHGVGRWMDDCGCHLGGHPDWHQRWRRPLREAMDWLRGELAAVYEEEGSEVMADPWAARDAYIDVVLDRTPETLGPWLERHVIGDPTPQRTQRVLRLLELQRHAMLMYTSCGWFFDDISGTEAVQILKYAARALELAGAVDGRDLEPDFVERLADAPSNLRAQHDGARIYARSVAPSKIDLPRVAAHYALSSLFGEPRQLYCYEVEPRQTERETAGKARLSLGRAQVTSRITTDTVELVYAALRFGEHHLVAGVHRADGDQLYNALVADAKEAFARADLVGTRDQLARHLDQLPFSLQSLFRSDQDRILRRILETPLSEADAAFERLYEHHAPLMRYLAGLDIPLPPAFRSASQHVLNGRLITALKADAPDLSDVRDAFETARALGVELDAAGIGYAWSELLRRLAVQFSNDPSSLLALQQLEAAAALRADLDFDLDLWRVQNTCYLILTDVAPGYAARAERGEIAAVQWAERFSNLCAMIRLRAEPLG